MPGSAGKLPFEATKVAELAQELIGGDCRTLLQVRIDPAYPGVTYSDLQGCCLFLENVRRVRNRCAPVMVDPDFLAIESKCIEISHQEQVLTGHLQAAEIALKNLQAQSTFAIKQCVTRAAKGAEVVAQVQTLKDLHHDIEFITLNYQITDLSLRLKRSERRQEELKNQQQVAELAEAKKEQSDSSKTLGKLSKKLEKQSEDAVNLERKVENAALTIADYEQRLASKNLEMDDLADKATSNDKRFEKLSVEYTAIETEKATLLTNLTREMKEMRDQHQKGVADLKFEYEQKCDAVKRENDRLSMELEIYKRTHISTERLDQTLEMLAQQINKTATMASVTSASKPAENAPHIQIPAAAEPIEAQLIPISPPPKSKKPRVKSKPRKAIAENQTLETLAEVEEPEEMEAVVEEIESAAEPLEQTFSEKPEKARVKTKSRKAVGGSSSQNLESLDEVGEPEEMEEIVDCLPQKAKKSLAKSTSKKVAVESGKEDLEFLAKVDEPEEPEAVFENADEPSTVKDTDKPSKSMKIVPKSKKSKSKSNVISLPILDPPRLNDLPEGPFNEETETAKLHSNAVRSKSKKSSAARNESDAGKSKRGKKVISERIEEQSEPDSPLEEGTVSPAEINSRKKKLPLAPSDKGNNINSTEPNKRRKIDANAAPTVEPVKMAFKGLAGSIFKKDRVPIESIGEGTELVPRIPQRYVDKRRLEMLQEED